MIKAILACDGAGGISKAGIMPWPRNKVDLARFSQVTKHHTIVMGRSTWEAKDMPNPLPNRHSIVITSDANYIANGADIISTKISESLLILAQTNSVIIIGGANLISQLWDIIDIFYLTRIAGNYDCDTFIPLDLINTRFELLERIKVDRMTTFETYFNKERINGSVH